LALADAAECAQLLHPEETVALINIGASSVSIHFTKGGVSNFIRDINWGGREMIQAISKARRCDYEHAEAILMNYDAEIANQKETALLRAKHQDQISAKTQSPASLLDPLEEELGDESAPGAVHMEDYAQPTPLDEIISMPVSRLVQEVRRSFDYYEHQLYERPVDRIILSGGVAHMPPIRQALIDDLGVETVEIANPTKGSIQVGRHASIKEFDEHPAQFMVAVGLAARGAADL
jgi:type IV pilus assembly protein PilM